LVSKLYYLQLDRGWQSIWSSLIHGLATFSSMSVIVRCTYLLIFFLDSHSKQFVQNLLLLTVETRESIKKNPDHLVANKVPPMTFELVYRYQPTTWT